MPDDSDCTFEFRSEGIAVFALFMIGDLAGMISELSSAFVLACEIGIRLSFVVGIDFVVLSFLSHPTKKGTKKSRRIYKVVFFTNSKLSLTHKFSHLAK